MPTTTVKPDRPSSIRNVYFAVSLRYPSETACVRGFLSLDSKLQFATMHFAAREPIENQQFKHAVEKSDPQRKLRTRTTFEMASVPSSGCDTGKEISLRHNTGYLWQG